MRSMSLIRMQLVSAPTPGAEKGLADRGAPLRLPGPSLCRILRITSGRTFRVICRGNMEAERSSAGAIPRRALGKTGLELSILGFGASPLGSVFEEIDEEEGIRAVHEAFARGINYFDVSPFYGGTKAEAVLGRALKTMPRGEFVLSTKVGRYGQNEFDFSAKRVEKSIAESCERLNVEYLDIVLCHDIEFVSLQQIVSETLPALHKLKRAGKIRFVGVSGLPLKIFRWILDNSAPGSIDVILSYCHYCLNDDSLASLLPVLEERGVGVINASSFSMGLLTPQGPPPWHPAPQPLKDACLEVAKHCADKGYKLPELALQFSTQNENITTTLVGMCTTKQVEDNIQALAAAHSPESLNAIADIRSHLSSVANISWSSGLPENN